MIVWVVSICVGDDLSALPFFWCSCARPCLVGERLYVLGARGDVGLDDFLRARGFFRQLLLFLVVLLGLLETLLVVFCRLSVSSDGCLGGCLVVASFID